VSSRRRQGGIDRYAENRGRVDLVILDMTMPRRSGGGDAQDPLADPAARIVLSSGHTPAEDIGGARSFPSRTAPSAGADGRKALDTAPPA
jgi:CheY-like chemotaxis protein